MSASPSSSDSRFVAPTSLITAARITDMPRPLPDGLTDPMPCLWVKLDGGEEEVVVFQYFPDELTFVAEEFVGLSIAQAKDLKRMKDKAYLQAPSTVVAPKKKISR